MLCHPLVAVEISTILGLKVLPGFRSHEGVCVWRGGDRGGNLVYKLLDNLEEVTIAA